MIHHKTKSTDVYRPVKTKSESENSFRFVQAHDTFHDHDRLKYHHEMAANIDKVKIVVVGDSGMQNSIICFI